MNALSLIRHARSGARLDGQIVLTRALIHLLWQKCGVETTHANGTIGRNWSSVADSRLVLSIPYGVSAEKP